MAAREGNHQTWQRGLIRSGNGAGTMAPALLRFPSDVLVNSDMPHAAARVWRVTGPDRTMGRPTAQA